MWTTDGQNRKILGGDCYIKKALIKNQKHTYIIIMCIQVPDLFEIVNNCILNFILTFLLHYECYYMYTVNTVPLNGLFP